MASFTASLLLGFLLGMRHALEPDHLAAVSVLVSRRDSPTAGLVLGAIWGLGHTLALVLVGCVLAVLGARLPPLWADGFELLVGLMLVTLGARAVVASALAPPARDGRHRHPGGRWSHARRPLVVGIIHGLAGSGAVTAIVLATLPTASGRMLYIGLFGAGSVIGMASLTGLAGWPLVLIDRNERARRWLSTATGAFSLLLGSLWSWTAVRALIG